MGKYEEFRGERRSGGAPAGSTVRLAGPADAEGIAAITAERYDQPAAGFLERTRKLLEMASSGKVCVFVSEVNGEVVGVAKCRYVDTVAEPVKFPSPPGWYGVGIIVKSSFRGKGVAGALSRYRADWLRDAAGAECLYSFASSQNQVSQSMHVKLGFEAVSEGPGFLDVPFDCGHGTLFRLNLRK